MFINLPFATMRRESIQYQDVWYRLHVVPAIVYAGCLFIPSSVVFKQDFGDVGRDQLSPRNMERHARIITIHPENKMRSLSRSRSE